MMLNVNLRFLEKVQEVTEMSQDAINEIDTIVAIDDYSDVTVESWHNTLTRLKIILDLQQRALTMLTEQDLKIQMNIDRIPKNL